ncbi:MAG: hypothetical protein ABJF04_01525 [Reichenbachiella sp.]|uniref:hypothetical protein n=1 Tax=Reichenbachiella sp. TaxID=2184521 RepID=UPI0032668F96
MLLLTSCSNDEQSCESISTYNYSHYRLETIELGNRYNTSYGSDGLNQGNEVVGFDVFYMEVYFNSATYAYTGENQTGDLIRIDDWLEQCVPDQHGYVQQIESIVFTTNLDYDDEFKAGDNINSIIELNKDYVNDPPSLADYLLQVDKPINHINSYYLKRAPTVSKNISISVNLNVLDGGEFEAEALPITFE